METTSSSWFVEVDKESNGKKSRKLPSKMNKTFKEALKEKYCVLVQNIKTQHYEIVFHGRPKTAESDTGELAYLRNVVLNDRKISRCGLPGNDLTLLCPNVVDLDLSGNLFESWDEVLPIISQLPKLSFLNLARNKISNDKGILQTWRQKTPSDISVENLVLNMTQIKWSDIIHLARLLPSLKELHICTNGYSQLPVMDFSPLSRVECLRLNNNNIERWEEVWKLRSLPNLKSLILSGNPLSDIHFKDNSSDINHDLPCPSCCPGSAKEGDENGNRDYTENTDDSYGRTRVTANQDCENENKGEGYQSPCDLDTGLEDDAIETWCRQILEDVLQKMQEHLGSSSEANTPLTVNNNGELTEEQRFSIQSQQLVSSSTDVSVTRPSEHQGRLEVKTCESNKGDNSEENKNKGENLDKSKEDSSECQCKKLQHGERRKQKPFRTLHNLCLSETAIGKWKHLSALTYFPSLKSLRIKDIKLASKLSAEDKRKLFVASIPNISSLNGSEVTLPEREKSERHYLRYFMDKRLKPDHYHLLEKKHGKMSPLIDIDIRAGYQEWAILTFVYEGQEKFREKMRVVEPVGHLRDHVVHKLSLHDRFHNLRLFLKRCGPNHRDPEEERMGLDELFLGSLPMSRFDILDGDEIHIETQDDFQDRRMDKHSKLH